MRHAFLSLSALICFSEIAFLLSQTSLLPPASKRCFCPQNCRSLYTVSFTNNSFFILMLELQQICWCIICISDLLWYDRLISYLSWHAGKMGLLNKVASQSQCKCSVNAENGVLFCALWKLNHHKKKWNPHQNSSQAHYSPAVITLNQRRTRSTAANIAYFMQHVSNMCMWVVV